MFYLSFASSIGIEIVERSAQGGGGGEGVPKNGSGGRRWVRRRADRFSMRVVAEEPPGPGSSPPPPPSVARVGRPPPLRDPGRLSVRLFIEGPDIAKNGMREDSRHGYSGNDLQKPENELVCVLANRNDNNNDNSNIRTNGDEVMSRYYPLQGSARIRFYFPFFHPRRGLLLVFYVLSSGIDAEPAPHGRSTEIEYHVIALAGSCKGVYWTPLDLVHNGQ